MTRKIIGALALALLVPATLSAQQERRRGGQAGDLDRERPNVARALVANREALALDADQVSRLESLAQQAEQRRGELRTLREQFGQGTELTEEQRGQLRESMRSAMQSEREVRDGIRAVLTVEQADRVAELGAALGSLGRDRPARGARSLRNQRSGPGNDIPRFRAGSQRGRRWAPPFRGAPGPQPPTSMPRRRGT